MTAPFRLCLIVLAGLALPAAAAAQAAPASPAIWRHGIIEPKGDGGFLAMVSRRDFAARHGLKIELLKFKNGAIAHRALLSGDVDSIESSPGAAILAGVRGADIKITGCDWPGVPHVLMARADVASAADLKGKTIAVAQPGSMPNLIAAALMEKNRIASTDVQLANLGGDLERYKALLAGIADAGIVAGEFAAIAPPAFKVLASGREVLPDYVRLCLSMTGKTLTARRDEAARFLAAQIEALRFAVSHRDETIALTRDLIEAKDDDPRPAYVFDDTVQHRLIDPDIAIPLKSLDWMQNELVKTGNLPKAADLSKLIDPDIRARALELAK